MQEQEDEHWRQMTNEGTNLHHNLTSHRRPAQSMHPTVSSNALKRMRKLGKKGAECEADVFPCLRCGIE